VVLASSTPPVLEVLRDRENGLAVDFFSRAELCDRIDEVFEHPDRMRSIREAARATAMHDFGLEARILPRWLELMGILASGQRPALQPMSPGLGTQLQLR